MLNVSVLPLLSSMYLACAYPCRDLALPLRNCKFQATLLSYLIFNMRYPHLIADGFADHDQGPRECQGLGDMKISLSHQTPYRSQRQIQVSQNTMSTSFTRLNTIPIVAYGVNRDVAARMDPLFTSTPFRMAAILDHATETKAFRYTHHNLGVVLFSLNPRPKVFITGAAISKDMTAQSIRVWDFYVRETRAEDTLVIDVSFDVVIESNEGVMGRRTDVRL